MAVTGRKTKALHHLREALAADEDFQTWVGAANATEAKARIVLYGEEESSLPDRPWVIMRFATAQEREQVAVNTFGPPTTAISVITEAEVGEDNQDDWQAANDDASDAWDALRVMLENCDNYEYDDVLLAVTRVEELVDDDETGAILWPNEEQLAQGSSECPYWQARALVTLGGLGE